MPFDPISWGIGLVCTSAVKYGLELAFPPSLRKNLEKEIDDWAKDFRKSAFVDPGTLFCVVSESDDHTNTRPALLRVREKLTAFVIPTQEEWLASFIEQWRIMRRELGDDAQQFFQLPENEAEAHLDLLASRIYRCCAQYEKLAFPHIVTVLSEVVVKLDRVLLFTEGAQLNAIAAQATQELSSTIPLNLNWGPNQKSAQLVADTARNLALRRGWPECYELHLTRGEERFIVLVFAQTDAFNPVAGMMEIGEEDLAKWSSLGGDTLSSVIAGVMFGLPLFTGLEESWNSMVEFVGWVASTLYPNSVRNGEFGILARFDLKRIGVPFPVGYQPDQADHRVAMMKLGGQLSVPFLTFGPSELNELARIGSVDAAGRVAAWLSGEWGRPTLIPRQLTTP